MRPSARNPGRENVSIWLVALSWALFNASIISLFTFAPDFMVDKGRTLGSAGFDTSLVMVGSLALSPIIGYAVDRVKHQELFIAAGGLGMAMLLLLVPVSKSLFPLLMVAIGISASLVPAPVYSLAADVASQKRLGLGFGILSMLNNAGVFVGPQLVGLSRDVSGSYRPGFRLMALFAVLSTVTATVLWMRRSRQSARLDCNSNNPR